MEALNRQKVLRCACGRELGEGGEGLWKERDRSTGIVVLDVHRGQRPGFFNDSSLPSSAAQPLPLQHPGEPRLQQSLSE